MKKLILSAAILSCMFTAATTLITPVALADTSGEIPETTTMEFARLWAVKNPISGKPEAFNASATANINAARDPWVPLRNIPNSGRSAGSALSVSVDYNGDGIKDVATIVQNSKQNAVRVVLGGNKGAIFAYKGPGEIATDVGLYTFGRRIVLNAPEVNMLLLTMESGKPLVYFAGD